MTNAERSARMTRLLANADINVTSLAVVGSWVYVDTFQKYEGNLRNVMNSAGFKCVKVSDGIHLDGNNWFRMVFKRLSSDPEPDVAANGVP